MEEHVERSQGEEGLWVIIPKWNPARAAFYF